MRLKFDMDMKFKFDEAEEPELSPSAFFDDSQSQKHSTQPQIIDEWINAHIIISSVQAAVDGSVYISNKERIFVEEVEVETEAEEEEIVEEIDELIEKTPEEIRQELEEKIVQRFYFAEPEQLVFIEVFVSSNSTDFASLERFDFITSTQTESEMSNYASKFEKSMSSKFKAEVEDRLQTRRRRLDIATHFFTETEKPPIRGVAANHLGFDLSFISQDGPDLWILIKFRDFKGVSKSDQRDVINIGFR